MSNTVTRKEDETKNVPVKSEMSLVESLHNEMNRLFEDFGARMHFPDTKWREPMTPFQAKIDVKDNANEVLVTAELPGVDMQNIDVTVRNDGLAISGEKKEEKEEKEKGYYRMERSYGSFYRLIPFPCQIDRDGVVASYKDGVLKITMPKSKDLLKKEMKVDVKAG